MSNPKKRSITHTIAFCSTCGWTEQDYIIAARRGRYHANKTGHSVNVEVAYFYVIPATPRAPTVDKD